MKQKQYDKIGKKYLFRQKEFLSKREDWARRFIKRAIFPLRGKRVLDLGSGNGLDIPNYVKWGAVEVIGIDESRVMIEMGKENISTRGRIVMGSMEKLPFPDNHFDIITARFSLHYSNNFEKVYNECARVMKAGGLLVIVATHPFASLLLQKNPRYGNQEKILMKIYGDTISVQFPSHTMKEYFSSTLLQNFTLEEIAEWTDPTDKLKNGVIPTVLAFRARKRINTN